MLLSTGCVPRGEEEEEEEEGSFKVNAMNEKGQVRVRRTLWEDSLGFFY